MTLIDAIQHKKPLPAAYMPAAVFLRLLFKLPPYLIIYGILNVFSIIEQNICFFNLYFNNHFIHDYHQSFCAAKGYFRDGDNDIPLLFLLIQKTCMLYTLQEPSCHLFLPVTAQAQCSSQRAPILKRIKKKRGRSPFSSQTYSSFAHVKTYYYPQ